MSSVRFGGHLLQGALEDDGEHRVEDTAHAGRVDGARDVHPEVFLSSRLLLEQLLHVCRSLGVVVATCGGCDKRSHYYVLRTLITSYYFTRPLVTSYVSITLAGSDVLLRGLINFYK